MVTVYTKNGCQACEAAKRFLVKRDVVFNVVNVDEVPAAREMLVGRGFSQMPVVDPGGVGGWFSGFNPDRLRRLAA
ncbi:glutaredoxin domain-containing protein [Schaalia sp. ZJ1691]|uniref:glutaredoxin domain-containing protein n=1 Tax=Schaalia sp. ZJ1691 TaxID=2709404 RepID=UPI0013EA7858|nr:glutaredoxin domain-containing protein [Schaalia sp. ZJ1691]